MIHEKISLRENNEAYMTTYIIDDPLMLERKRPIVVICPGGGYEFCSPREAEPVALAFNSAGFHAVVVNYSIKALYPKPLIDLSNAVCIVREHEKEWRIDTDKVIVCGFSAGGHLAASLGVFWNSEEAIRREDGLNRPNGMILAYPVITSGPFAHTGSIKNLSGNSQEIAEKVSLEKQVTKDTPRAFIWHTFEDKTVPVENSLYMAEALRSENIPTELHIYPNGGHGLSLATEYTAESDLEIMPQIEEWIHLAVRWIKELDINKE